MEIHVRIIYHISEKEINILIKKYESQIEENLKKLKEKNSIIKKQFIEGERFLLLGRYYELKLLNYVNFKLRFDGKFLLNENFQINARKYFILFYKKKRKKNPYRAGKLLCIKI